MMLTEEEIKQAAWWTGWFIGFASGIMFFGFIVFLLTEIAV